MAMTNKTDSQTVTEARQKAVRIRVAEQSPEERSAIAQKAAETRWEKAGKTLCPKVMFGSKDKPLIIGDLKIQCYVLENGQRVISQTGMCQSLGITKGRGGSRGGARMAVFIGGESFNGLVDSKLDWFLRNPVKFRLPGVSVSYGFEATILPEICGVVLDARKNGKLQPQQIHIAEQCEVLLKAFAKVGIIALIDEATGYQETRKENALQKFLEKFLSNELQKWVKTFPLEFYTEIFRLKKYNWTGERTPRWVGTITNDLVYSRLAPGVLVALREKNPISDKGYRLARHHQFLGLNTGHPALDKHLQCVIVAMKMSDSWEEFHSALDRLFPVFPENISKKPLALPPDITIIPPHVSDRTR